MDDQDEFYEKIRCPKCKRRLNKPMELKCRHYVCRECLETILRNHRTNACCPACDKPLEEYEIEKYTFLPLKHFITRLLASYTDVNQCETCQQFTIVQSCSKCSKDQCELCLSKHEETHEKPQKQININLGSLSKEELEILETLKNILTEKEYEDFVQTARTYVNNAISKRKGMNNSKENDKIIFSQPEIYDWSKHEKINADIILNSSPERIKQLLRLNFTPRPYQIRMVRAGLRRENSLVCLQTGAGKTFVAGIVAKFFYILSLQKSNPTRRFKAVFLVPIKALVDQQCEAFKKVFIDQPDAILKTIENQAGERFKDLYEQLDIFFITVQKFANFVEAKHADLRKFDLIIVDECHHCYDNHPINSMMRQYLRLKVSGCNVPQIIALTGSVGTNKKNAFNHLVHLCANLDCFDICAIQSGAEEDELRQSTNTPLGDTIVTVSKEENDPILCKLQDDVMTAIASHLAFDVSQMDNQKMENFLVLEHQNACKANDHEKIIGTDYLRKLNRFRLFYEDLPLDQCKKQLEEALEESKASSPTDFDRFCQKKLQEFRECMASELSKSKPLRQKLRKLVELIVALHKPGSRGLVLVRTKFHTVALEEFLNKRSELVNSQIIVGRLTGQGPAEELCLPGTLQATVLKEFRKGTKNLLVATDVAQEGIDVAECSYVIRYEFVSNEIGSVQGRGRARAAQSQCFLITETLSINHQRETENRIKEEEMKQAIEEWRIKGSKEFKRLVTEEQDTLIERLCLNDSSVTIPIPTDSSKTKAAKAIHCRFCDTYLCSGSSLRTQGTTIVCVDSKFEELVKPPKSAGEKFNCPNPACHRELGVVILLSRNTPAYALQITSLKFLMNDLEQAQLYKKWSLYPGHIKSL